MTFTTQFQYKRYEQKLKKIEDLVNGAGKRMGEAAGRGDVGCENAEFQYAEENLQADSRIIGNLKKEMQRCHVIHETDISTNSVGIGTGVKVKNLESNAINDFNIVGIGPTDTDKKEVSYLSPIGRGLLGAKVGEVIHIKVPSGERKYSILEISKYFPNE